MKRGRLCVLFLVFGFFFFLGFSHEGYSVIDKSSYRYDRVHRAFSIPANETEEDAALRKAFGVLGLRGASLLNEVQWENYRIGYYGSIDGLNLSDEMARMKKDADRNLSSLMMRRLYHRILSKLNKIERGHLSSYMGYIRSQGKRFAQQKNYLNMDKAVLSGKGLVLTERKPHDFRLTVFGFVFLGLSFICCSVMTLAVLSENFNVRFCDKLLQFKNPFTP